MLIWTSYTRNMSFKEFKLYQKKCLNMYFNNYFYPLVLKYLLLLLRDFFFTNLYCFTYTKIPLFNIMVHYYDY